MSKEKAISTQKQESDLMLSLVYQVRKDFPHMGANKIRTHLQPRYKSSGIEIGRDQFRALLSEQRLSE